MSSYGEVRKLKKYLLQGSECDYPNKLKNNDTGSPLLLWQKPEENHFLNPLKISKEINDI